MNINGKPIDEQTRCVHYYSPLDIIAIRFKCCNEYYPCIHCHEETAGHAVERWRKEDWNSQAILCGACKYELTINEYMNCAYTCPSCGAPFNQGCRNHNHFYFEMEGE
ncbi:MAG: hypothetical protein EOO15_20980 [Chitinophagaceae bacterium]|nr:MAG: hypothetical protein EOO15_20980 [Chitinophagaceae bacterium]